MRTRVGLLGGSFDPIHYGHLAIAEDVRIALQLERVIFIPVAQQPFKIGRHAAAAPARLAMAQLACASNPAFEVSSIELERPGPSYTITTLEAFNQSIDAELYLILGADTAADLPRWHAAARVAELARLVVVERPRVQFDGARLLAALPAAAGRLVVLAGPQIAISSTLLRQRAAAGLPLRYLTPDPVAEYIHEHRPYQGARYGGA